MSTNHRSSTIYFGPWIRRSPYFEATQRYGAQAYDVYNHMYLPADYGREIVEDYWTLLNAVTVWDVSVERQVEITGPDAFNFTNMLTPRDLTKCDVWQCQYVLITDAGGGIINDPVLTRLDENHFWLSLSDSDVLLWAKGVAINAGMDVTIVEPDVSPMQVQGPKSKPVMQELFGDEVLGLEYYYAMPAELDGIPVVVTRTGWTGEVGYEIYLRDGSCGIELWEKVMEAGKPHGILPTPPSEIRRIEAGILNYGSDMTLDNNPYEVGLDWTVDLDQAADFIGKDALTQIKRDGVSRKLVGVELDGDKIPWLDTFWSVYAGDEQIGQLSAATYSPRLEKNIGYAMVPIEHAALGTTLRVEGTEGTRSATVVSKPFVDPDKDTPKS